MTGTEALLSALRARAHGLSGFGHRVRLDLTDTGGSILLDGTGPRPEVVPDDGQAAAEAVLRVSSDDLTQILAGRLNPVLAVSGGRLCVDGSKGVAMRLAELLDEE